jgi:hypothetical protein
MFTVRSYVHAALLRTRRLFIQIIIIFFWFISLDLKAVKTVRQTNPVVKTHRDLSKYRGLRFDTKKTSKHEARIFLRALVLTHKTSKVSIFYIF